MAVADDNDGFDLGRMQPPQTEEEHSCSARELGGLWRAGPSRVWATHSLTSTNMPTYGDGFGMTSCIFLRFLLLLPLVPLL